MGIRNYLVEGVSGAGKTSVATELQRRGYHVLHGDRELAYKGDPVTGLPLVAVDPGCENADVGFWHRHHLWDLAKVNKWLADRGHAVTFFCGGARNLAGLTGEFDGIFVLDLDAQTLRRRLASRPDDEFGARREEQEFILRLLATQEDLPQAAVMVDARAPLTDVVDAILSRIDPAGGDGDMV